MQIDAPSVAIALALLAAFAAAARALQLQRSEKEAREALEERVKALEVAITGHAAEIGTHRSPDWERQCDRRLESIETDIRAMRSRGEEDRTKMMAMLSDIRVEIARGAMPPGGGK